MLKDILQFCLELVFIAIYNKERLLLIIRMEVVEKGFGKRTLEHFILFSILSILNLSLFKLTQLERGDFINASAKSDIFRVYHIL